MDLKRKKILVSICVALMAMPLAVLAANLSGILNIIVPFREHNAVNGVALSCGYGCNMHEGKDTYAVDFDLSIANGDEVIAIAPGTITGLFHLSDSPSWHGPASSSRSSTSATRMA